MSVQRDRRTFTQRIAEDCGLAAWPSRENPHSLALPDQLLVSGQVAELLGSDWIHGRGGLRSDEEITTFRKGLLPALRARSGAGVLPEIPDADDVQVLRVTFDDADERKRETAIYDAASKLRADLAGELTRRSVRRCGSPVRMANQWISPNHVLIPAPASDSHGCPWGPPEPADPPTDPGLERSGEPIPVIVIDSGFQWDEALMGPDNPLDPAQVVASQALGLDGLPDVDDVPDANHNDKLDVLAGHANFIAGVVAQTSPNARVTVINHNGGFAPGSDDLPTEATVALSMAMSTGASVMSVGFAFLTNGVFPSLLWDLALSVLGPDVMIVIPAGNQGSNKRRYPAALALEYDNLISVGSIDGTTPVKRSSFSNHGDWISCWTQGAKVTSTFLRVNMELEDGPAKKVDFADAWATWNGTSFAAPRVAGLIAQRMADNNLSARDAWQSLLATKAQVDPDLGIVFP